MMTSKVVPRPAAFVYDGDCGLCEASVQWMRKRGATVEFVAYQHDRLLAERGLTEQAVASAAYFDDGNGLHRGHRAIAAALTSCPDRIMRLFAVGLVHLPFSLIARAIYAIVARYRHRLPGSTDACAIRTRAD